MQKLNKWKGAHLRSFYYPLKTTYIHQTKDPAVIV